MDPLTENYPWYTPYQFAGNTPIRAIDLDGKEEYRYNLTFDRKTGISVLTKTDVKHFPSTDFWGRPIPGREDVDRAIVQYNDQTYHIGFSGDDDLVPIQIFSLWKQHPNAKLFAAML